MKKPTIKRMGAYIIDMILVLLVSSMFSNISAINPNIDNYEKVYNEYNEYISKNTQNLNNNDPALVELSYKLSKEGIYITFINLVVTVLYFVVFQYFNNGQTIGKRIFKIRVVPNEGKKLKFWNILVRALIINSIVVSALSIISLKVFSMETYTNINQYLQILDMSLLFVSIGLILFREDGRGLHDFLGNTKVIIDQVQSDDVKEANIVEEKKVVKRRKNDEDRNS